MSWISVNTERVGSGRSCSFCSPLAGLWVSSWFFLLLAVMSDLQRLSSAKTSLKNVKPCDPLKDTRTLEHWAHGAAGTFWGFKSLARRERPTASGCNDAMENTQNAGKTREEQCGKAWEVWLRFVFFYLAPFIMSNPAFLLLKLPPQRWGSRKPEQTNGASCTSPCDALLCSVAMATAEMPWQQFSPHSWTAPSSREVRHGYKDVSSFCCFVQNEIHLDPFGSKLLDVSSFSLVSLHK